jgi:CsoR family transcriptional regulator, copper-sensing transcriptional repressor
MTLTANRPTVQSRGSVLDRLASAHGHLGAIRRMAANGHPCPEVIYQLRAVRSALVQVEQMLVRQHLHHCLVRTVAGPDTDVLDEIVALWEYNPNPRGTRAQPRERSHPQAARDVDEPSERA